MIKELMLPPIPGTNTAHPAFACFFSALPHSVQHEKIECGGLFNPISAAAIAHYWRMHQIAVGIESDDWDVSLKQRESWSSIAAGSRDFDGAEIVGYTIHHAC